MYMSRFGDYSRTDADNNMSVAVSSGLALHGHASMICPRDEEVLHNTVQASISYSNCSVAMLTRASGERSFAQLVAPGSMTHLSMHAADDRPQFWAHAIT